MKIDFFKILTILTSLLWVHSVSSAQINGQSSDTLVQQTDSTLVNDSLKSLNKKKYQGIQFLRIGADIKSIVMPVIFSGKSFVEIAADYKYKDKLYWAGELGWGNGTYDYPHLNYSTKTTYLRLGLDNSILNPKYERDFDIAFVGFRYGMGLGKRSVATYAFDSPFGGEFSNEVDAESFFVHWGEIVAGMKLEIIKNVFVGWTGRAKFLFNNSAFETIKPHFVAGYGNADKSTSFDIGLYVQYKLFQIQPTPK